MYKVNDIVINLQTLEIGTITIVSGIYTDIEYINGITDVCVIDNYFINLVSD